MIERETFRDFYFVTNDGFATDGGIYYRVYQDAAFHLERSGFPVDTPPLKNIDYFHVNGNTVDVYGL